MDKSYIAAGFNRFFRRSLDNAGAGASSLEGYSRQANQQSRAINFDQAQVSGSLNGVTKIGDKIVLDGTIGRISTFDGNNNEVVRIGDLGD